MDYELCSEGRVFLADRQLSIPIAEQLGVYSHKGEIAFPYILDGKIIRTKFRSMSDKKKQRFDKVEDSKDFKMPFWNQYNWPTNDYLIITEGEFDSIALFQCGLRNVVSLPNGAGSVASTFRNQYEYLQQYELIYIAFDMDSAGEKAAEEAKKIIRPEKYRRIHFPSPAKDANDWIKDNPLASEEIETLMRNASKVNIDEIINIRDLPLTYMNPRNKGTSTGWNQIDQFIGGIRTKELTVISADTGAGKTTFCINLLCNIMKNDSSGFWINSWEMDHEIIVRKIASIVLGNRFKIEGFNAKQKEQFLDWMQKNNALINPKRSRADIKTLRDQIDLVSKVYGVKYILLDHLDYITATSDSKETHEKVKEAISALHDIAMDCDVHIFLIAHPKQTDNGTGEINMSQLKGSAAIKQYADTILLLQNMAQVDLSVPDNRLKVSIPKNRFFGTKGQVFLRYMAKSDTYIENSELFNKE